MPRPPESSDSPSKSCTPPAANCATWTSSDAPLDARGFGKRRQAADAIDLVARLWTGRCRTRKTRGRPLDQGRYREQSKETMKIVRFRHEGRDRYGALENDRISALEGTIDALASSKSTAPIALKDVRLLAPTIPSKIVAIGLNYADHAAEGNRELPKEPMLFIKPSTAVIG